MGRASEVFRWERFGRYTLLTEVASGGMGRVFVARASGDAGLDRLVAVKRIHPQFVSDADVYAMIADEARIGSLVRHPNVVSVIDVVDAGRELLLVLDYVEGVSLARLRELSPSLSLPVLLRIAVDALRGLHAAHETMDLLGQPLHIVHRDVSPQNLLVGSDGSTRIIDFGIATGRDRWTSTRTGVVKGKLRYLSPEQIDGGQVDRRTDLFAMGSVLYEQISQRAPFGGTDESSRMAQILLGQVDLAPIAARAPSLVEVLGRALARSSEARFVDAPAMIAAIVGASPVAEPEEVAATVRAAMGSSLFERRKAVQDAIVLSSQLDDQPLPPVSDQSHASTTSPNSSVRRASVLGVVVLVFLFGNVVGWTLFFTLGERSLAPPQPAASVHLVAPQVSADIASASPTSLPVLAVPETSATSSPAPDGKTAAPRSRPTASADPKGGLHDSPYRSLDGGLR